MMTDNESLPLNFDGSYLQYLQLKGDKLTWTSDLESLKHFVEKGLKQQGKWSSPGGNSKQFKSSVNNLTITWYSKKQLTLAFQGRAGPVLKGSLTKLVRDNAGRTDSTGSNVSSTVEQVNPLLFEANDIYANQPRVAEAGPVFSSQERSNTELVADLEGIKLDLLILQKKVEANSNLLSINCHNREEFAVSAELCE